MSFTEFRRHANTLLGNEWSMRWGSFKKRSVADLQKTYDFEPKRTTRYAYLYGLLFGAVVFVPVMVAMALCMHIVVMYSTIWWGESVAHKLVWVPTIIPAVVLVFFFNPVVMWLLLYFDIVKLRGGHERSGAEVFTRRSS